MLGLSSCSKGLMGLMFLMAGCATLMDNLGPNRLAELEATVATYPADIQVGYERFRKRCDKCHGLGRPMSARGVKGSWKKVVRKMARRKGAGIPPKEVEGIANFLEHHFTATRKKPAKVSR